MEQDTRPPGHRCHYTQHGLVTPTMVMPWSCQACHGHTTLAMVIYDIMPWHDHDKLGHDRAKLVMAMPWSHRGLQWSCHGPTMLAMGVPSLSWSCHLCHDHTMVMPRLSWSCHGHAMLAMIMPWSHHAHATLATAAPSPGPPWGAVGQHWGRLQLPHTGRGGAGGPSHSPGGSRR